MGWQVPMMTRGITSRTKQTRSPNPKESLSQVRDRQQGREHWLEVAQPPQALTSEQGDVGYLGVG